MDIIKATNEIYKQFKLKNIKNYYELAEFCALEKNREFCRNEKILICKLSLKLKGYTTTDNSVDYCKIYKDLLTFSKKAKLKPTDKDYLDANCQKIASMISDDGSYDLQNFINSK